MAPGLGDHGGGDVVLIALRGDLEALEAEVIDGSEVSSGDLVDGVGGLVEKDLVGGSGELEAVLEIGMRLVARE